MKWETQAIKTVYAGLYDGPHATPPDSDNGAIFLGISNITEDGRLNFSDIKYISEDDLPRWTKRVVPRGGDIVFSYEATLNRYAIIPEGFHGCLGRRMALIRPNEQIALGQFLYYYFFSDQWRSTIAENTVIGATVDRIPLIKFPDFPVSIPELDVQKKIVEILSAYDNLIENNQKQIKLLEEAAQRLYKEWFIDLRFPGYETTPVHDGVPEGWEIHTIEDLCIRVNAGGTPSRTKPNYWSNASISWYKTGELQDCWLIDSEEKISEDGLNNSSAKMFPANTVVMAIYASPTLGRLGILSKEAACNQAALCLLADENKVSWQWLYHKLYELRDDFNAVAKGAGQQNISADVVKKKNVLVPSAKSINHFTNAVKPMYGERLLLQKQNNALAETRDRLLPKLINGEIEV